MENKTYGVVNGKVQEVAPLAHPEYDLMAEVIANRGIKGKLLESRNFDSSVKFTNYKMAVKDCLEVASAMNTAVHDRYTEQEIEQTRSALFTAWKAVLKFFEDNLEDGRIRPRPSDAMFLMSIASRNGTEKSATYADLVKERTAARKEWESDPTNKEKEEKVTALNERIDELKAQAWNYYAEQKDVSIKSFREQLENLVADILEERKRKTFAEREEERKAENKRKRKSGKK